MFALRCWQQMGTWSSQKLIALHSPSVKIHSPLHIESISFFSWEIYIFYSSSQLPMSYSNSNSALPKVITVCWVSHWTLSKSFPNESSLVFSPLKMTQGLREPSHLSARGRKATLPLGLIQFDVAHWISLGHCITPLFSMANWLWGWSLMVSSNAKLMYWSSKPASWI